MWPQTAAMNSSGDQAFPLPLPKRHGQWSGRTLQRFRHPGWQLSRKCAHTELDSGTWHLGQVFLQEPQYPLYKMGLMVTTSDSVRVRRDDAPKAFRRAPCTQQELISGSSAPMGQGWKEAALPQGSGWGKSWDPASEGVRFTHWHWWEQHWGGQGPASFHRVGPGQTRVRLGLDWRFRGRGTQHAGGCNRWTKVTWLVALCDS